jgi:hypothetical protein
MNPAETLATTMFQTVIGEQLHANTNAKEGTAAPNHSLLKARSQSCNTLEPIHAVCKRPNARQHNPGCVQDLLRIRSNAHGARKPLIGNSTK